jgi:hypothetical protein
MALASEGALIAVIADEDTITGFLLAGLWSGLVPGLCVATLLWFEG